MYGTLTACSFPAALAGGNFVQRKDTETYREHIHFIEYQLCKLFLFSFCLNVLSRLIADTLLSSYTQFIGLKHVDKVISMKQLNIHHQPVLKMCTSI